MILETTLPAWQHTWRHGFAPNISTAGLLALRTALLADDPRLIQGNTTTPLPMACVMDWPVEAGCATSLPGWLGDELETVAEVEEYAARIWFEADERLGEPGACRWFLNWWDDTPRETARPELLAEVERELGIRAGHTLEVA
jgi:hypothetical protein